LQGIAGQNKAVKQHVNLINLLTHHGRRNHWQKWQQRRIRVTEAQSSKGIFRAERSALEIARQGCHFYQLLVVSFSKIFIQGTSLEASQHLSRLDESFLVWKE